MEKFNLALQAKLRNQVYGKVEGMFPNAIRVDEGYAVPIEENGTVYYVVVRGVVKKPDSFDVNVAAQEYADKVAAAEAREAARLAKKAEREAKAKARAEEKAKKEAKEDK